MSNFSSKSIKLLSNFTFITAIFCYPLIDAKAKRVDLKKTQPNQQKTVELPKITVTATSSKNQTDGYKANLNSSSTKTPTPILNIPQSISVVTQEQIRDQNITNMSEALRYVPGINVQQGESNRDQVTIRGNVSNADFFIDGTRDDMQYFRDFYNTERIEVLKGSNAMAFGRGGSGGVVNRISKFADGKRRQRIILSGGSFNNRRAEADFGDKINDKVSFRINTMYEKSGTFRKYGDLERYGFNPTATINLSDDTDVKVGYEHFSDNRFNDRGIPSSNGRALKTDPATFFGNPNENYSDTKIDSTYATITHDFDSSLKIKNHTRYTKNSKYYKNVFTSGAVDPSGNVNIEAYDNDQTRNNFINQTDLTKKFTTGFLNHLALVGVEITRQDSSYLRKTGNFNNSSTTQVVSLANPINLAPITYRLTSSANDIHNDSKVRIYSAYLQDQIEIGKYLQLIGGLRYDNFEIDVENNRTAQNFKRTDNMISPRLGLVFKPRESLSIYTNYSTTYLPSAGDQFDRLAANTVILEPEKMQNYEIGFKWDITSKLNFSTALYQLNRTNTRANDPNNSGFFIPTGETQTKGFELALNGQITDKWQLITGYAFQDAKITSKISTGATSSAAAGKRVGLVPRSTFSMWNKYDFNQNFAAALGVINQSSQFTSVDNTVKLKGFTRFDGAAYYKINSSHRLQLNVENIFGAKYILTAHNNNNIQPGSPRAFKVSLIADF